MRSASTPGEYAERKSSIPRMGEEEWKLSILNDRFIVPVDWGRFDLVSSDFD